MTDTQIAEDDFELSANYYLSSIGNETKREQYTTTDIAIPVNDGEGEIVIDTVSDLPDDSSEMCGVLTSEQSSHVQWLAVGKAYANQGKIEEALNVARTALNDPHISREPRQVQALFHNFIAWLYLTKQNKDRDTISLDVALTENKTALTLNQSNETITLCQALLSLSSSNRKSKSSNFEKESRIFDSLLHKQPKNCYALMGKAKIFFYRENYLSALKLFQKCLSLNPLLRPDPRIGIGLCYWLMERKELASQAWQNSIQVNPEDNLEAKILISLAKFDDCFTNSQSDGDFMTKYQEALDFTKASHNDDPNNEVIQVILSSYFFSKGDYDVTERICKTVVKTSKTSANVKSDANFWLARCKFVNGDIIQAQKLFSDSIKLNEKNMLSRVGYGQCLVVRKEFQDAIRTFEKIQESNSRILEVTYALGMLYSKTSKTQNKSIAFLEKYVKLAADQHETVSLSALLALSKVYEEKDLSQSLKYLQMAKDQELASGKSQNGISYALLNNIGVFALLKSSGESPTLFEDALSSLKEQESGETKEALEVTLKYNIARYKESTNKPEDIKDAMKLYDDILAQSPNYISAKLRWLLLACVSENKNIKEDVIELLDKASDDLEVRSFYGWYVKKFGKKHHIASDTSKDLETEHHRETLVKYTSHDTYALISLGNVYCTLARDVKDQAKKDQYYVRAAQLYQKSLTLDPHNAFAAQGIAIIFADKKQSGVALEIFRKVRDSLNDVSIYLNLGHCLLEVKQFAKAIESYDIALSRFSNGEDVRTLNFLSRAWMLRGLYERNLDYFKTSLDLIKKANELSPSPAYKFNIAFVQFQFADFIRKLQSSKRTVEGLEKCVYDLEHAIKSLEELSETERPPYPASDLKLRVNAGNALVKNLEKSIQDQREYEIEFDQKLKEAKRVKEEEESKKLEEKLKQDEENKKQAEKLAAQRKELEEKAKEWNQLRLEEEKDLKDELDGDDDSKPKKKRGRKPGSGKKKKAKFVASDESDGSGSDDDADLFGEDETSGSKRKRKSQPKKRAPQKKSKLSKETIEDSDEDLDDIFGDEADEGEEENSDDDIIASDNDEDDNAGSGGEANNEEPEQVHRKPARIIDDDDDEDDE